MKIIGKFNSFNFTFDELKIPFHTREGVGEILKNLSTYLNEYLLIDFGDGVVAQGEIDSYSGKKKVLTLNLLLKLPSGKGSEKYAKYVNVDPIILDINVDRGVERPLEKVDHGFLRKIKLIVGRIAREINSTESETIKLLLHQGEFGKLPISTRMYQVDAEAFYNYIIEFVSVHNIPVDIGERYNTTKAYLKHCRKEMRCVVCGQKAIVVKGLYPVCKKHRDEYSKLKTENFEKKYKFKEELWEN